MLPQPVEQPRKRIRNPLKRVYARRKLASVGEGTANAACAAAMPRQLQSKRRKPKRSLPKKPPSQVMQRGKRQL